MRTLLVVGMMFGLIQGIQAQQGWVSCGWMADGSGGSSTWTVGQLAFEYQQKTSGGITPGVQQSVYVAQQVKTQLPLNRPFRIFPNPVQAGMPVYIDLPENPQVVIQCYSPDGRQVFAGVPSSFNTHGLSSGLYIICLQTNDTYQVGLLEILP